MALRKPDPGKGIAFPNTPKAGTAANPKAPQHKGLVTTPEGVVYAIAVWERTTQKGGVMWTFALQEPRDGDVEGDDGVPF